MEVLRRSVWSLEVIRFDHLFHVATFKCQRDEVFYVQESTGLRTMQGCWVIVGADRGIDNGTSGRRGYDDHDYVGILGGRFCGFACVFDDTPGLKEYQDLIGSSHSGMLNDGGLGGCFFTYEHENNISPLLVTYLLQIPS